MNDFNKRYDFDRAQRRKLDGGRIRAILILLVVLAVTGAIIYLIIPHGEQKKIKKPAAEKTESGAKQPGTEEVAPQNGVDEPGTAAQGGTGVIAPGGKSDAGLSETTAPTGDNTTSDSGTPTEGGVDDPLERAKEIVVQPGEDLGTIARRHHTTVEGIKHFNGLKNDKIKNGQKLKVIPGPWRITVRNELTLEHAPDGKWQLFKSFPADANGTSGEFAVSYMLRNPDWIADDGSKYRHGDPENPYGSYLLMLARRKNPDRPLRGFGIHGVDDKTTANLKNCGRGCIHVGARDIELLYYLVCPGTEVTVIPGETARKPEM